MKLALTDIHKLIELFLSTNYFIFDNRVRILENSCPTGLALMVVISEAFLQRLEGMLTTATQDSKQYINLIVF